MRIAIVFLALGAAALAQVRPEWDNPAIVHVGTEKPHALSRQYAQHIVHILERYRDLWCHRFSAIKLARQFTRAPKKSVRTVSRHPNLTFVVHLRVSRGL